jgi:hypothetical protein
MPTLYWIGKKAVLNHHRQVPYRLLHCDASLSAGDADAGNLLVQGDNLEALKALLPYYAGKVKCIYIDPPYNTGNEKWVYNDAVNSPEMRNWLGKVVGAEAELPDTLPLVEWLRKQPARPPGVTIPEERPAETSPSPMFDPNTVYFGKAKASGKHAAHLDCASNGQARLIVRLANIGVSGWVNVPADEATCLKVLGAVDARLHAARKRFDELAESRTSDPRLQAQIVDQLTRWFVHGRNTGGPVAADTTEDADEAA